MDQFLELVAKYDAAREFMVTYLEAVNPRMHTELLRIHGNSTTIGRHLAEAGCRSDFRKKIGLWPPPLASTSNQIHSLVKLLLSTPSSWNFSMS